MDVYCQMVGSVISGRLCESEQGTKFCVGCTAATRRCKRCSKTGEIAFPKHGLCKACAENNGVFSDTSSAALPGGTVTAALTRAVSSIRELANKKVESRADASARPQAGKSQLLDAAVMAKPETLFPLIQEHAELRPDGTWRVKQPIVALMARAKLLRHEAVKVIESFVANRLCQSSAPWQELRLFSAPTILVAQDEVGTISDKEVAERHDRRRRKGQVGHGRIHARGRRQVTAPAAETVPAQQDVQRRRGRTPAFKLSVSPHVALETLRKRSCRSNGEVVVRGALLTLMHCHGVLEGAATAALESLQQDGLLTGRDGWRSVILTQEAQAPAVRPAPPPVTIVTEVVQPPPVSSPPVMPPIHAGARGKTFDELYRRLIERSSVIGGERLVRGAVPLLQTEYRVAPTDVVKALERLVSSGHVRQCNGWGTIVLLSERVENGEIAIPERAAERREPTASTHGSPRAAGRLRVISSEGVAAAPQQQATTPTFSGQPEALVAAIADLEARLPELRRLRDKAATDVAMLEVSLAALRACRDRFSEATSTLSQSSNETETTVARLLALLQGNAP